MVVGQKEVEGRMVEEDMRVKCAGLIWWGYAVIGESSSGHGSGEGER